MLALQAELDAAGIRSKRRLLADGGPFGGQRLSRGALYLMLRNRIYRGEITHKGNAYPAEHQPIVDQTLWDQVQAILAVNRVDRATGAEAKQPSLLAGLVFDESGERRRQVTPSRKGRAIDTMYRRLLSSGQPRTGQPDGASRHPILRPSSSQNFEAFSLMRERFSM